MHIDLSLSGGWKVSLLLLLLSACCHGYPGGAPDMSCESMLPSGHGAGPQTSLPPYSIYVAKKRYKPGETLQVIVQSEGDDYFRGIFLQARMIGCNVTETKTVGVFTNADSELETKHCFGDVHSAVSHNSASKKRLKTFYWTAPVLPSGHVVMRATMVRNLHEYWIDVESDVVADLQATVAPRCYPPMPSPTPLSTRPRPQVHEVSTNHPDDVTSVSRHLSSKTESSWRAVPPRMVITDQPEGKALQIPANPPTRKRGLSSNIQRPQHREEPKDSLPSWIGPTLNQRHPGLDQSTRDSAESWLIPAAFKRSAHGGAASTLDSLGSWDLYALGSLAIVIYKVFLFCL